MNPLAELTKQVEEMESFIEKTEREQLTYPLDVESVENARKNIMTFAYGTIDFAGDIPFVESLKIEINGKKYLLPVSVIFTFA